MPAFPAGAWRPFDLAVAFTIALSGMAQGGGFVITGRLKVDGGSVDGSTMVVYREGQKQRTVSTDLNKFSLELDLNTSYVLSFEKDGFVTKKLSFDTHAPAAAITNGFTPCAFVVSLFKQYDGVNTVAFNPPVWVTLAIWLPMTLVIVLALLRPMKGLMLAAQFMNKASQARHD